MLPMVRAYMLANTILVVIPSALWIASIHTDYPNRLGFVFVALWLGQNPHSADSLCSGKPDLLILRKTIMAWFLSLRPNATSKDFLQSSLLHLHVGLSSFLVGNSIPTNVT